MKKYIELDINFFGLKVPNVGFLILEEPNQVLNKNIKLSFQKSSAGIQYGSHIRSSWINMGKENLTPLSVQQEVIHSYFLSSVCTIMLRFQMSVIMGCGLFTTRWIKMYVP